MGQIKNGTSNTTGRDGDQFLGLTIEEIPLWTKGKENLVAFQKVTVFWDEIGYDTDRTLQEVG
jgi:hypothetical protein